MATENKPISEFGRGEPDYLFGFELPGKGRNQPNLRRCKTTPDLLADARYSYAAEDGKIQVFGGDVVEAGGARYEVVADPGETLPKRMLRTAAPVTLKFAGSARMDITAFGAVEGVGGAAATTRAVDAAMAEAAFWQRAMPTELGTYPLSADGPAVYLPAGRWYYEGAGLDRTTTTPELSAKAFAIRGEHRGGSILLNKSDCYLLKTHDTNALTFEHFTLVGGKGLWVAQSSSGNVRGGLYASNLLIKNFTECALGHNASDFPFLHVSHCQIEGLVTGGLAQALFGICFPGLTDEVCLSNNSIGGVRYGIKLTYGGNHAKIINNGLFGKPNQSGGLSADIWIVPRSTETNAGQGLIIDGNKFGPEGIDNDSVARILFADEDTANTYAWQRPHSAAKSTGYAVGARISKNDFGGNNNHRDALIYSTTHRLNGLDFTPDNSVTGFVPSKLIEYSPEVLADYAAGSLQMRSGGRLIRSNAGIITPAKTSRPSNMRGSNVPAMPDFGNGMEGNLDVARGWVGEPDVADYIPIFAQGSLGTTWLDGVATGGIDDPFGGTNAVRVNPSTTGTETRVSLASMRTALLAANVPQGAVGWVECWMRSAGGLCGYAGLVYGSSYDRVVNVNLEGPAWQLVRFPVTLSRLAAGTGSPQIRVGIPGAGAVNGQPVDFYGARFYVARSPVSAGHLRAGGANAGAWNGPHVILGGTHLWIDAGGALRKKSSAPTSDTDGALVSADASAGGGGIVVEGSLTGKDSLSAPASTATTLYTLGLARTSTLCLITIDILAWSSTALLETQHKIFLRNNGAAADNVTEVLSVAATERARYDRPAGPAVVLNHTVAASVVSGKAVITLDPGANAETLRVRARFTYGTPPIDTGVGVTEH